MANSLKEKAVKGVAWNLTERFGIYGLQFVLIIILARILSPEDFGLIGIITVFFTVAQVFIEGGFGQAYVQKKSVTNTDATTIFYTNLGISMILYGVLWILAPYIAYFYNLPALIGLIRVMGLILIINAFNVIQIAQLTRAVNFKRKAQVTFISTIISGILSITGALNGLGVWSLVIQQLSNRLLIAVCLWFVLKWKPTLEFSLDSFKKMFSFGVWILGAGIIRTVFDNIYILTIGKFFPITQLGFYTKSKQIQKMASVQISNTIGIVAFPLFSQLQDDKVRLQNTMKKFLTHTLVFIMPILVVLIIFAKPFVILLLTEKWAPMIPYLQLLCIVGILYPIHKVNIQVLIAQGKSNLNFRLVVIKNSLRIINIMIMYRYGVIYIIFGEVIVSIVSLLINTYYTKQLIDFGISKQLWALRFIFAGGIIAGGIGFLVSSMMGDLRIYLLIGVAFTGLVYVAFHYYFNKAFFLEIYSLKNILVT